MAPPSAPKFGALLPPAPHTRRGIPLYYDKSEEETRQDVYERYDELVTRQTLLYLADALHGGYPFQPLRDYVDRWLPAGTSDVRIADIGCSVGRLIGDYATLHPDWDCYGIDFSYQMLRQAQDHWKKNIDITPNISRYGYPAHTVPGTCTPNLHFALADAAALPFSDASLKILFSTFLIDRVADPLADFNEWQRVVAPSGIVIVVSPLNFLHAAQWERYYPPVKLLDALLRSGGWRLIDLADPLLLREPMDARGNAVEWQTIAFVLQWAEG